LAFSFAFLFHALFAVFAGKESESASALVILTIAAILEDTIASATTISSTTISLLTTTTGKELN